MVGKTRGRVVTGLIQVLHTQVVSLSLGTSAELQKLERDYQAVDVVDQLCQATAENHQRNSCEVCDRGFGLLFGAMTSGHMGNFVGQHPRF